MEDTGTKQERTDSPTTEIITAFDSATAFTVKHPLQNRYDGALIFRFDGVTLMFSMHALIDSSSTHHHSYIRWTLWFDSSTKKQNQHSWISNLNVCPLSVNWMAFMELTYARIDVEPYYV